MLPRQNRLTKREDFFLLFKKGFYVSNARLTLRFLQFSEQSYVKIGFPIGKKYSKKAVVRNKAKRILREATRIHLAKLKPSHKIIILLKPTPEVFEFQEFTAELGELFKKANLFL